MAVGAKEELEVKIMELEKEKKANEKKINQQQTKLTKLTAELREEKEVQLSISPCIAVSLYWHTSSFSCLIMCLHVNIMCMRLLNVPLNTMCLWLVCIPFIESPSINVHPLTFANNNIYCVCR